MHLFIIAFLASLVILEIFHYFKVTSKSLPTVYKERFKYIFKNSLTKTISPLSLIFIVYMPFIFGLFINYENFSIYTILVFFMWMPIYSILFILTRKKIFLFLIGIPLIVLGTFDILAWMTLGGPLTREVIFLTLETNYSESAGYFTLNFSLEKGLAVLLYWILGLYLLLKQKKQKEYKLKMASAGIYVTIIISIIGYKTAFADADLSELYPPLPAALIKYQKEISEIKRYASIRAASLHEIDASPFNTSKKQLYVLIIGESTSRNHMSLYGYHRNTNPLLGSRDDIFVFNDVISAFTSTRLQLNSSLTFADQTQADTFYTFHSILDLVQRAGFKTYWVSNQDPIGFVDNQVTLFAKGAHETYFVKHDPKHDHRLHKYKVYDESILPVFEELLKREDDKKFIIVHLEGTHYHYRDRYPPEFDIFKEYSSHKEKIINEYNNSIVYNDFIINSIFDLMKNYSGTDKKSAALYFSDHGQEVYDLPSEYAGHGSKPGNKYQVEIPFIVWLSESFIKKRYDDYFNLKFAIGLPYIIDDLIHSKLNLMGIESPLVERHKSIFAKEYEPKERLVYGIDYDLEMKHGP